MQTPRLELRLVLERGLRLNLGQQSWGHTRRITPGAKDGAGVKPGAELKAKIGAKPVAQDGARTEDGTTAGAEAGNVHGAEVKIIRD